MVAVAGVKRRTRQGNFVPIECWAGCGEYFFKAEVGATGAIFMKCDRCGSYNVIDLTKRCERVC